MAGSRHEFKLDNGTTFYIRRYDVFLAMRILGDLQKRFLGPLTQVMEANDKSLPQEVRDRNMQEAIDKISRNLDGDSLVALTKQVLDPEYVSVTFDGQPPEKLEEMTIRRLDASLYEVVALVFEVVRYNYEDLFTRGRTLIGQAAQAAEKANQ